jgi:glycosyltransferase involved in cell wall biosynthesis
MPDSIHTLLVISSALHYAHEGRLYSYAPYVRELELWADLFPRLCIAAPCRRQPPPPDCAPFGRTNIAIEPQREAGGDSRAAKFQQVLALPVLAFDLCRAMRRADAIHLRGPGNLGLLGAALAPLFSRHLVAKYAGQWTGYPGEPRAWRWQRALLASGWWRGPVMVYGEWPDQPAHVVPFFTSALTEAQVQRARAAAARRDPRAIRTRGLRVLFIGRLSAAKNVGALLDALALLKDRAIECDIVGEGPERGRLVEQTAALGLGDRVRFAGGVSFDEALGFYERNDALVLVSETEGWPKAIAEAMAFGLLCIGSDRGLIPKMLGDGRGMVAPPGDARRLAAALAQIADAPDSFGEMIRRASAWGSRHSLEELKQAIRNLLREQWKMHDLRSC